MHDLIVIGAATPTIIRVVEDIEAREPGRFRLLGFVDSDPAKHGTEVYGVPVLGPFESCRTLDRDRVRVINAIAGNIAARIGTTRWFLDNGFVFANVVHPSVNLARCRIGTGNLIYENATIHPFVTIGNHCVISSNAGVAHETVIGDYCFIGPASYLCGKATVGNGVYVGVGAHVLPRLSLGDGCTVAAGALVRESVAAGKRVRGVPGSEF